VDYVGINWQSGFYRASIEEIIHACQKPVALYEWLLTHYAHAGDKILDTHVGSASSLIACHQLGFEYWGFELDTSYFEAASKRLASAVAQVSMMDILPEMNAEQTSL
jgi:site-specific DNA-methyltransferase (adenine-specific)